MKNRINRIINKGGKILLVLSLLGCLIAGVLITYSHYHERYGSNLVEAIIPGILLGVLILAMVVMALVSIGNIVYLVNAVIKKVKMRDADIDENDILSIIILYFSLFGIYGLTHNPYLDPHRVYDVYEHINNFYSGFLTVGFLNGIMVGIVIAIISLILYAMYKVLKD